MKNRTKFTKLIYLILGSLCLGLGCLGIIIPILPTVPFFLLTSFFFARGSGRFYRWFIKTKIYIKYVSGFAEHRTMSIGGQLFLLISVTLILSITCLMFIDSLVLMIVLPIVDAIKYIYFIRNIKTVSKDELAKIKHIVNTNKLQGVKV